jgi:hypothetical protein
MTEQEVKNNNTLIAIFMGWETSPYPNLPNKLYKNDRGLSIDQLQYHTSWDHLMPVLTEIAKPCIYRIYNTSSHFGSGFFNCEIIYYNESISGGKYFISKISHTQIEATWLAIISYITFINKQVKI